MKDKIQKIINCLISIINFPKFVTLQMLIIEKKYRLSQIILKISYCLVFTHDLYVLCFLLVVQIGYLVDHEVI